MSSFIVTHLVGIHFSSIIVFSQYESKRITIRYVAIDLRAKHNLSKDNDHYGTMLSFVVTACSVGASRLPSLAPPPT
jgi:hypothetical protein